jgi:hypothetical protein
MSDHWLTLIPEGPYYIPDTERQARALARLAQIAPDARKIEITRSDHVQFFDCGTNFQRIRCPTCGAQVSVDWWLHRMDDDFGDGFRWSRYVMPCCGESHTMHELDYEWPQGFGRFALEAMNANIGKLDPKRKSEMEELLGTQLRVIYRHL